MKKIYSFKSIVVLAMALFANVAVAQNLIVTANGVPVSDGDVVEVACEFEDYSEPGFTMLRYAWYPELYASTTSGRQNLTVTVTSVEDTDGFQLCWPQNCLFVAPGGSATSTSSIDTIPQDLQIHKEIWAYSEEEIPTAGGEIKVKLEGYLDDIEFTVKALLPGEMAVDENFADQNEATTYFTLEGLQVDHPAKGMYIVKKGAKAKLMYIK